MKKFEYLTERKDFGVTDIPGKKENSYLESMGKEGWELVNVLDLSFGNSQAYYWKREVKHKNVVFVLSRFIFESGKIPYQEMFLEEAVKYNCRWNNELDKAKTFKSEEEIIKLLEMVDFSVLRVYMFKITEVYKF